MNATCKRLRATLVETSVTFLRDDTSSREHVEGCDDCFAFVEALVELDGGLADLPRLDAPDSAVDALLAHSSLAVAPVAVEGDATASGRFLDRVRALPRRSIAAWGGFAAAAVLIVIAVIEPSFEPASAPVADTTPLKKMSVVLSAPQVGSSPIPSAEPVVTLAEEVVERVRVVATEDVVELENTSSTTTFSDEFVTDLPVPGRFYQGAFTLAPGVHDPDGGDPTVHGSRSRDFKATVGGVSNVDALTGQFMSLVNADSIEEMDVVSSGAGVEFGRAQGGFAETVSGGVADGHQRIEEGSVLPVWADTWWESAREFLDERAEVDGIGFVDSRGYWSNTYVPGDSALRLLHARVGGRASTAAEPHRLAMPVRQPFDEPQDGALALFLHSDRASIRGEERALIQVGLQGSTRSAGRRPAMNVALVLDARREFGSREAAGLRALLEAFASARQPHDRFSLLLAGRPGGEVLAADSFRYGPLRLFLDDLSAGSPAGEARIDAPTLTLIDAVREAIRSATELDEPEAVLGTSSIVLVTASPLVDDLVDLVAIAGQAALDGVPFSVIGVGTDVVPAEIERVALAGQGNRRVLQDPADAVALVNRELSAVGRAIARAVRLNIRLAPGVRLVEVIGSERLDRAATAQVRASEQSIDQRVSQSVGIDADRGEDDDGIQILIPAFFAGDSHVILLDVVTSGPGPLAQVDARFKDLVQLKNGVAHASLSVGDVPAAPGPLELNVLKNLLAWMTASALDEAGEEIVWGDAEAGLEIMTDYHDLLRGISRHYPALRSDPEIERDLALIAEYRAALRAHDLDDALLARLADSLRYAGMLKVLPTPTTQ